jgi:hypothetical protein
VLTFLIIPIMKKVKWISAFAALVVMMSVLNACKDDEPAPDLTLQTMTAGSVDLNGATSANNVATNSPIVITFSTDVDASTATDANVSLIRTYDNSQVAKTIAVTGNTITITPTAPFYEGDQYKVSITNALKSTGGKTLEALERTFGTVGVGLGTAPQSSSQTLYIQFSNGIADLTGNATVASEKVAYTADRFGKANSAANFRGATTAGSGDLVELSGTKFISASMTLSVWFYINQADYVAPGNKPMLGLAGNNGYFIEIGDGPTNPNWLKPATNHKVIPDPQNHVYATSWGDFSTTTAGGPVSDLTKTGWHQLVFTYDAATYLKTTYFDGVKVKELNLLDAANNEWNLKDMAINPATGVDAKLALGYFASKANTNPDWAIFANSTNTFKGYMDDLRIFSKALTASEVTALYNAEKAP